MGRRAGAESAVMVVAAFCRQRWSNRAALRRMTSRRSAWFAMGPRRATACTETKQRPLPSALNGGAVRSKDASPWMGRGGYLFELSAGITRRCSAYGGTDDDLR